MQIQETDSNFTDTLIANHLVLEISLKNCIFHHCHNILNGGALFINNVEIKNSISQTTFSHCTSLSDGGALYIGNSFSTVLNSICFSNNEAFFSQILSISSSNNFQLHYSTLDHVSDFKERDSLFTFGKSMISLRYQNVTSKQIIKHGVIFDHSKIEISTSQYVLYNTTVDALSFYNIGSILMKGIQFINFALKGSFMTLVETKIIFKECGLFLTKPNFTLIGDSSFDITSCKVNFEEILPHPGRNGIIKKIDRIDLDFGQYAQCNTFPEHNQTFSFKNGTQKLEIRDKYDYLYQNILIDDSYFYKIHSWNYNKEKGSGCITIYAPFFSLYINKSTFCNCTAKKGCISYLYNPKQFKFNYDCSSFCSSRSCSFFYIFMDKINEITHSFNGLIKSSSVEFNSKNDIFSMNSLENQKIDFKTDDLNISIHSSFNNENSLISIPKITIINSIFYNNSLQSDSFLKSDTINILSSYFINFIHNNTQKTNSSIIKGLLITLKETSFFGNIGFSSYISFINNKEQNNKEVHQNCTIINCSVDNFILINDQLSFTKTIPSFSFNFFRNFNYFQKDINYNYLYCLIFSFCVALATYFYAFIILCFLKCKRFIKKLFL